MKSLKIIAIFLFIVPAFCMVMPAEEPTYTFIIPVDKGLAETSFVKVLSDVTVTMNEITGLNFKVVKPVYEVGENATEVVMKALKDNTAQMGYVNAMEYAEYIERNPKSDIFQPEFTITMDKKKYSEICMYVANGGPVDDVAKTRGLKWGGSDTVPTRLILYEKGIDEPLAGFYKSVKYVETSPVVKVVDALVAGDIDVFVAIKAHLKMSGKVIATGDKGKGSKGIPYKEIYCTPYENNWIFGYRKDVPQEVSGKITKAMLGAHKNKAFEKFKFLFIAVNGNFVPFNFDEDFKRSREIVKLKAAKGWEKERLGFWKKTGRIK